MASFLCYTAKVALEVGVIFVTNSVTLGDPVFPVSTSNKGMFFLREFIDLFNCVLETFGTEFGLSLTVKMTDDGYTSHFLLEFRFV